MFLSQLKRLNFLGQNDSIFSLSAPREKLSHFSLGEKKLSHFDPRSWVIGWTKIWPNLLGQNDSIFAQCTERNNWVIFTLRVELLAELKFDPSFQVKMTQFFCLCTDWKKLSHFDLKSWVTGGTKILPTF